MMLLVRIAICLQNVLNEAPVAITTEFGIVFLGYEELRKLSDAAFLLRLEKYADQFYFLELFWIRI